MTEEELMEVLEDIYEGELTPEDAFPIFESLVATEDK